MLIEFKEMLTAFYKDDAGATAIEYGLIIALVGMVIVAGVTNFGSTMTSMYLHISSTTDGAVDSIP